MKKTLAILGSTGSIGDSTLLSINNNKSFKIVLLSSNSNIKKLFKQAKKFNVKNVIIEDKNKYNQYRPIFKKKKINLYLGLNNIKNFKEKIHYCVNGISGIDGLEPSLNIIPLSKNFLIANKESIICGWDLMYKN